MIAGREVYARVDGAHAIERGRLFPVEGCTTPYMDPATFDCHRAANEPARPPETAA